MLAYEVEVVAGQKMTEVKVAATDWANPYVRLRAIEDDVMIGESLVDALRAEGYAIDWVRDGDTAATTLRTQTYDLIVLDLGLLRRSPTAPQALT